MFGSRAEWELRSRTSGVSHVMVGRPAASGGEGPATVRCAGYGWLCPHQVMAGTVMMVCGLSLNPVGRCTSAAVRTHARSSGWLGCHQREAAPDLVPGKDALLGVGSNAGGTGFWQQGQVR